MNRVDEAMGGRSSCCSENDDAACDKTVDIDRYVEDAPAITLEGDEKPGNCAPTWQGASRGLQAAHALDVFGGSVGSEDPPLFSDRSHGSPGFRAGLTGACAPISVPCTPGIRTPAQESVNRDDEATIGAVSDRACFEDVRLSPLCDSQNVNGSASLSHPTVTISDVATSTYTSEQPMTWSEKIDALLNNSIGWSIFVCILTIWALFADDIRVLCLPKSVDLGFLVATLCILAIFLAELCLCCIVQEGYVCSLGAFMDFLAAISLVPFEEILRGIEGVGSSISVARVARAARALRILRATRAAVMALKTEARVRRVRRLLKNKEVSVLADTLIQSTNIKVLLGILVLLIGSTLLNVDQSDRMAESGLEMLDLIYEQDYLVLPGVASLSSGWASIWHDYRRTIEGIDDNSRRRLVKLQIWGITYLSLPTEDTREKDLIEYSVGDRTSALSSFAIVSEEDLSKAQAVNSLIMTCFCIFVIILWGWSFRRDHNKLVLVPVHRMMRLLSDMTSDPRMAIDRAQQSYRTVEMTEMDVVENCITKFGGLLKVGFGEAGMNIIAQNMSQANFDPVAPGVLVKAIFGFCDIRNFTDCCEVLNEDTLIFTNRIAHIVHGVVEESGGTVNKNIGDAFLSVWKLNEISYDDLADEPEPARISSTSTARRSAFRHHLTGKLDTCDASMRAFVKMNKLMKSSDAIQQLSSDSRLQNKLPGYHVRLGSGLHLGWAVEGAVGTPHKVDATYLSPHVNMAARLEAATKQYGVAILISEPLVQEFGPALRSECRPVDRVTVKGSAQPLILYVHMPSETIELSESQRNDFMVLWQEAFVLYQSGKDWGKAAELIAKCLEIRPTDQPAKVLLDVIEKAGGKAPPNWPGYRELTEK